jgi:predicted MarR family transcription regulator
MRAVDDSSPKYAAVLHILRIWKQLPESDIARMLRDYHLITNDFREMEDQGLLTMAFVGDEYMITPTLLGRLWLEQYESEKIEERKKNGI